MTAVTERDACAPAVSEGTSTSSPLLAAQEHVAGRPHSWSSGDRARFAWFALLLFAICFEGLGRKLLPSIPVPAWYFLKDAVLLLGLGTGILPEVARTQLRLFGGFAAVTALAIAWTCIQTLTPDHLSMPLGLFGVRAYWLWWLAPVVIASNLRSKRLVLASRYLVVGIAIVVALMAVYQFNQPADAAINQYGWSQGDEGNVVATVASTGRVRVTSTFSFLTGFTDFVLIVAPLLLGWALSSSRESVTKQGVFYASAGLLMVTGLASGSRGFVVITGLTTLIVLGFRALWSRSTPYLLALALAAVAIIQWGFADAAQGIVDRFTQHEEETSQRFGMALSMLPPIAAFIYEYPILGIGTGMTHSAAPAFGVYIGYFVEDEGHQLLVEQGLIGYLLVSAARIGLALAAFKLQRQLARAGEPALAGVGRALIAMTFIGSLFTDHVMQALYFSAFGMLLSASLVAEREL
jgi:hypothetical protein